MGLLPINSNVKEALITAKTIGGVGTPVARTVDAQGRASSSVQGRIYSVSGPPG